MHELQPLRSAQSKAASPAKSVEYVAPPSKALDQYASEVCRALEQKLCSQSDKQQSEFVRGFAAFVKTIVRIHVKYLNQGGQHEEQ